MGVHPWRIEAFPGLNFGELVYDHEGKEVVMKAIGVDNRTKFSVQVSLEELVGGKGGGGDGAMGGWGECTPVHGVPAEHQVVLSKAVFVGVPGVVLVVLVMLVGWWARWCWGQVGWGRSGRLKGE